MSRLITGIYAIRNAKTGDRYIGQAVDIKRRWIDHRKALGRGLAPSPRLQEAWNKFGEKAFVFEVLQECSREELEEREDAHMREGCAYNHVTPLPELIFSFSDPKIAPLLARLDEVIASMSEDEIAASIKRLDAEEKEEEAAEAARIAGEDAISKFCESLWKRPKGDSLSAVEYQRVLQYLAQGETFPAVVAARVLKYAQQFAKAEELLLQACGSIEMLEAREAGGVAPWPYESLAKLYRKFKRYDDEIKILERYAKQPHAAGDTPQRLLNRLDKAKALCNR